jgi:hypothetical protein
MARSPQAYEDILLWLDDLVQEEEWAQLDMLSRLIMTYGTHAHPCRFASLGNGSCQCGFNQLRRKALVARSLIEITKELKGENANGSTSNLK